MSASAAPSRLTQAAAWRARLAETPGEHVQELEAWLEEDPRNRDAWQLVQAPWQVLGEHATTPELIRLRHAALAHAHDVARGNRDYFGSLRFGGRLGAVAATILVAVASVLLWQARRFDIYRTGAGERRVVTLDDGSQMALDSQTEVRVRYGTHARELALMSGQARFDVAHDIERPFSVSAEGHKVVATGTAFNVDLLGPELLVTLIEGHVVVLPQQGASAAPLQNPSSTPSFQDQHSPFPAEEQKRSRDLTSRIELDAGEQLVLSPRATPHISRVNIERTTAWENGELVFENEPLSSVVARVSRYGVHVITIGDQQTSGLRISGVFHEGDIEGFVSTIVSYLPVRAQESRDGSIRLSFRQSGDDH